MTPVSANIRASALVWNLVMKRMWSGMFLAPASMGSGFERQFPSLSLDLPRLLGLWARSLGDSLDGGWDALYQDVSQGLHLAYCCILSQKSTWHTTFIEWVDEHIKFGDESKRMFREGGQGRQATDHVSRQGWTRVASPYSWLWLAPTSLGYPFSFLGSPEWQLTNQRYCDNELPNDLVLLLLSKRIFD